jgi:hypothetical protein
MNMVRHQAVSVNPAVELPFELNEIFPIIILVVIGNKNCLPIMTPLYNMMWSMRKNYSSRSWHKVHLETFVLDLKKIIDLFPF